MGNGYIRVDDELKTQIRHELLDRSDISIESADEILKKIALHIAVQKSALGIYDDTQYLSFVPGYIESIQKIKADNDWVPESEVEWQCTD